MRSFERNLATRLEAGTKVLELVALDEHAALEALERIGEHLGWPVHTWSATTGIDASRQELGFDQLLAALERTRADELWVAFDAGAWLTSPTTARRLREQAQRRSGPALVLVDPQIAAKIVERIPELAVQHLPNFGVDAIAERIGEIAELRLGRGSQMTAEQAKHSLARACLGLPPFAIERLATEAMLACGDDPAAVHQYVGTHKAELVDRIGLLSATHSVAADHLGGLEELKTWLERRRLAFAPQARAAAIPYPRGVLLLGVQGCGKSLAARVAASILELPLVRFDPGRVFAGTVGESEANLRRATAALDTMAPCVVWIDEIDKGLAGSEGSASDGGTTARVVGELLNWLQERTTPAFVIATANDVERLPPELLRRGRLDETFFIDLPSAKEREAILGVHLHLAPGRLTDRPPPLASPPAAFAQIAREARDFSGAELEAALVEARLSAFAAGRPLDASDFRTAIEATVPLAVTRRESVDRLRAWATTRARPASRS